MKITPSIMRRTFAAAAFSVAATLPQEVNPQTTPFPMPAPYSMFSDQTTIPKAPLSEVQYFDNVMKHVRAHHYSKERIDAAVALIATTRAKVELKTMTPVDAITDVLRALDPHSYIKKGSKEEALRDEQAGWKGAGFDIVMRGSEPSISSVYYQGNARKGGLAENDVLTHINGAPVKGLTSEQIRTAMCGKDVRDIKLTYQRAGTQKPYNTIITCSFQRAHAVQARVINNHFGYVRIDRFTPQAAADMIDALKEMEAGPHKIYGYILDLRDNLGGAVDEAHKVIDAFVDSKDAMIVTATRNGEEKASATFGDVIQGKRLNILINDGSFSASEMVALALQYFKRAKVFGRISGGKGSMQTLIPLNAEGNEAKRYEGTHHTLYLTTAIYMVPDGTSPQVRGVIPNVEVAGTYSHRKTTPERLEANVLDNPDLARLAFAPATLGREVCVPDARMIADFAGIKNADGTPDLALICAAHDLVPSLSGWMKVYFDPKPGAGGLSASAGPR